MPGLRPCLDCGRLSPGRRCPDHAPTGNTSWNGTRDRAAQQRFRRAILERAGERCEYVNDAGGRCPRTQHLQAHHTQPGNDDPTTGVLLCREHHRLVDQHAR